MASSQLKLILIDSLKFVVLLAIVISTIQMMKILLN